MKNQNPQDILNEILLRMRYDSSKTLSENKILVEQMSDYYYTQLGNLQLKPVNSNDMPASQLYPNIKNGQYPKTVPTDDYVKRQALNTWFNTKALRNLTKSTTSSTTGKEGNTNIPPLPIDGRPTNVDGIKKLQDWLDYKYPTWYKGGTLNKGAGYGTFGPSTTDFWDKNPMVKFEWQQGGFLKPYYDFLVSYNVQQPGKLSKYKNFSSQFYGRPQQELEAFEQRYNEFKNQLKTLSPEDYQTITSWEVKPEPKKVNLKTDRYVSYKDATQLNQFIPPTKEELAANREISAKVIAHSKRVTIQGITGEFEVPSSTELYYWSRSDFENFEIFKQNVIESTPNSASWFFSLANMTFASGKNYAWVGKLKGFKITVPTKNTTFKTVLGNNEVLGYGIKSPNGEIIYYDKNFFVRKTDWEELGPDLLTYGSILLAVLAPATWPLLLVGAGMDLYSAKMLADQGQTDAAKLSTLLAFTPFIGKLAVKVSKAEALSLSNKFKNIDNVADAQKVIDGLNTTEKNILKNLQATDDLASAIKTSVKNPEVKTVINDAAKKVPGLAKKSLQRAGLEIGLSGALLAASWSSMKSEILQQMTYGELIKQTIEAAEQKAENEETKKKLSELKETASTEAISIIKNKLSQIIEEDKKYQKSLDESFVRELEAARNAIPSDQNTNNKITKEDADKLITPINNIGNMLDTPEPDEVKKVETPTTQQPEVNKPIGGGKPKTGGKPTSTIKTTSGT